jgi:thiol-disulfide isomerase/thioredoxin
MNRRNLIVGGTGAAAALAGVAWQQMRSPGAGQAAGQAAPLDEATTAFWQASFAQPDGQALAMAAFRGQPLVLNFWATWCPPCVKEMPELDRFAKQFAAQGGRVVGLAVDNPTAVRNFLQKAPVSYAIGLAGFDGTDLSRKLGNSSGALPYTAGFDKNGVLRQRRLGETSFDELTGWAKTL